MTHRPIRAALVLSLLTAACGPPPLVQRDGWQGSESDVADLLRGDFDSLHQLHDLTAEARLTVIDAQRRQSVDSSILFQPPDLLRLDVQGPLFQRVLTAVIVADTLIAVAEGQRTVMPARDGLDYYLDIDLGGYDPRWALLGVTVPGQPASEEVLYPRADRAVVVLKGDAQGSTRRLSLDLHRGFVDREEIVAGDGTVLWSRQMRRYRRLPGTAVYLPGLVRIEGQGRVLELEYGRVRIDRGIDRAAFFSGLR